MAFRNIKQFVKSHTNNDGSTIIVNNYGSNTSGDQINVLNVTSNDIDTYHINAKNADIINANVYYLMADDGTINKLSGEELQYTYGQIDSLKSKDIETNKLKVNDEATINKLIATDINSSNIVTDYLTVNKSAHFFELIIDKIRSVQGTQINTAANCVVDYVEAYQFGTPDDIKIDDLEDTQNIDYYRIYWRCTDNDGREVSNDWLELDLALCESFNVNNGTSYDVGNKYYWRKVINVDGGNKKYINLNTGAVTSTQPSDYQITFSTFSFNSPNLDSTFTDFTVTPQILGEWNNGTWTCSSTNFGLQLTYYTQADSPADQNLLGYGTLTFTTDVKTMLNIGVYYTDGTVGYFPADSYKTNYSITTERNKVFEAIVITTTVIDSWELCNWIDLSNNDMDATQAGKSAIPSIGDNVCQLGYRYDELGGTPSQAEISRASAIIIAAYDTPDSDITPPSYAQYKDIGTDSAHRWDLGHYRHSYFDAKKAYFEGEFAVNAAGQTMSLEDYINDKVNNNPVRAVVQSNGYDFDLCVLQCQEDQLGNLYIEDLNNFPSSIDLKITGYSDPRYLNVQAATLSLFGRTLNLIDLYTHQTSDTAQGIYVSSVTMPGVDYIHITFGYRGTAAQQIDTGTTIAFAGQFRVGEEQGGTVVYTNYNVSKSVSIAAVTTAQGANAELWQLNKECEIVHVNNLGNYECLLRYGLNHIIGSTGTTGVPTTEKLKITHYDALNTPVRVDVLTSADWDSTNNRWEYTWSINDWYSGNTQPTYIRVELLDSNNNILDTSVVNIMIDTTALFTVQEGLTTLVQANTNYLQGEITGIQSNYSILSQTVNGLSSTVASHTTDINGMQQDISQIQQTATGISLQVNELSSDVNGIESGLQSTGIDIVNGEITLYADKTHIDGSLDLTGDFESYNEETQNRTRITTSSAGTSGLIMSGPDRVDQVTGIPDLQTQEVDLIKMEFTTTAGARAGTIKVQSANSNNIYTNIWQESIGISNDDNYITLSPDAFNYGLRGSNRYNWEYHVDDQRLNAPWPVIMCNSIVPVKNITSGSSYNAKLYEGFITFAPGCVEGPDGYFYLYIPSPSSCAGKIYYIKNYSNIDIRIGVGTGDSNKVIMDDDDRSLSNWRQPSDDSEMLISDGNYWIAFECA